MIDIIEVTPVTHHKKSTFMYYLTVFMKHKSDVIKANQIDILTELTDPERKNIVFLFSGEDGWARFAQLVKEMEVQLEGARRASAFRNPETTEVEIPAEISYATQVMRLLAIATEGKNAITEVKSQSLFGLK